MDVTNVQLSAWRRVSQVYTEIYPHQAPWTQTWVTTTFTVDLEMVYFCDSAADGKFSVRLLNSAGTSSVCLCWPGQCPPHSVDRMAVNDLQLHCAAKLTSLTTYWSIENYTSQCVVVFRTRCMGWVWMWTGFWTEPVSLTDCLHSASLLSLTFTMCVPPQTRKSQKNGDLGFLKEVEEGASSVRELRAAHAETIQELQKTRNLLSMESKICRDYKVDTNSFHACLLYPSSCLSDPLSLCRFWK